MKNVPSIALWVLVAIVTPVIIIGGLLGALSSAGDGLERVPVALVNNDELIRETNEEGEETVIFASKPLVTELVTSEDFAVDWLVTNSEQARALLASGDVYAIVEIPEGFSLAVSTLDSSAPQQATFTIVTDSSRSYLAGVLSDQVGAALAAGVSDEFGSSIMEGLFAAIVDVSNGFQETADAAGELASGVEGVSDGMSELASGYEDFDDGLGEFTAGTRGLSDGLDALSASTSQLSQLSTGLSAIKDSGALTGNPAQPTLNTLIDALAVAIPKVSNGIVALDKGADAIADSSVDVEAGSGDIREGLSALAEGTETLSDGSREFADGLADGAAELGDNALATADDETSGVLTSPVVFTRQDRSADISLQETFSSVLAPVGLWLVVLLYFLVLPSYSSRVLSSSARTSTLLTRALRPVMAVVLAWTVIVTVLIHTLGSVPWASGVLTGPLVALSALAFASLHFAVWAWNPRWLAPLSLGAFVIQIVSLGNLVPLEILPTFYQAISGLTPLGWSIEALIAAFASAEGSRVWAPIAALAVISIICVVLAALSLQSRRSGGIRAEVMLPAGYPTR